jgi:D-glycero-D-manno-heptose 1,7-bisphosphate phosphatase
MHPALFLDRDGVIIENRPDYIRSWSDVSIFPRRFQPWPAAFPPYKIVLVTNQSAVGRAWFPWILLKISTAVWCMKSNWLEDVSMAFSHALMPQQRIVTVVNPTPGLIYQATRALELDLNHSILIGDALSDLEAARARASPLRSGVDRQRFPTNQPVPGH